MQCGKYVFLGRLIVQQRNDFHMIESPDRSLLASYLRREALGIGNGILQVVLRVRIIIDADSNHPRRARALQTVGAGQQKIGVLALHIVAIKSVGRKTVRAGHERNFLFD